MAAAEPGPVLLEVETLKVHFPIRRGMFRRTVGFVRAVDGVTLAIREGRTLALVGESGCGKTTAGKAILQLISPTAGSVRFHEAEAPPAEFTALKRAALRPLRRAMQIIFQDLHPRCPKAQPRCREAYPEPLRLSATHQVNCVLC